MKRGNDMIKKLLVIVIVVLLIVMNLRMCI